MRHTTRLATQLTVGNCGAAMLRGSSYMILLWASDSRGAALAAILLCHFGSTSLAAALLGVFRPGFNYAAIGAIGLGAVGVFAMFLWWHDGWAIYAFAIMIGVSLAIWSYAVDGRWNERIPSQSQKRFHAQELAIITVVAGAMTPLVTGIFLSGPAPALTTAIGAVGLCTMLLGVLGPQQMAVSHARSTPGSSGGRLPRMVIIGVVAGAAATMALSGPEQLGVPAVVRSFLSTQAPFGFALITAASSIGAGSLGLLIALRERARPAEPRMSRLRLQLYGAWIVGSAAPLLLLFPPPIPVEVVAAAAGFTQGVFVSWSSVAWRTAVHVACDAGQASRVLSWDRSLAAACALGSLAVAGVLAVPAPIVLFVAVSATVLLLAACWALTGRLARRGGEPVRSAGREAVV